MLDVADGRGFFSGRLLDGPCQMSQRGLRAHRIVPEHLSLLRQPARVRHRTIAQLRHRLVLRRWMIHRAMHRHDGLPLGAEATQAAARCRADELHQLLQLRHGPRALDRCASIEQVSAGGTAVQIRRNCRLGAEVVPREIERRLLDLRNRHQRLLDRAIPADVDETDMTGRQHPFLREELPQQCALSPGSRHHRVHHIHTPEQGGHLRHGRVVSAVDDRVHRRHPDRVGRTPVELDRCLRPDARNVGRHGRAGPRPGHRQGRCHGGA